MTSRERVRAALQCLPVDRVPWVELGNKGRIVEALLERPLDADLMNGPGFDQSVVARYVADLIEFSEKVGIDAVLLKFWTPVFNRTETVDGGKTKREFGLIRDHASYEECRRKMPEPVPRESPERSSAGTYQRVMSGNRLARGFQVGSIYGFVEASLGFEEMCLAFYDDPDLVRKVTSLGADHVIETTRRLLNLVDLDFIVHNDDIAFKTAPLVSPVIFRDFFYEHYARLGELLAEADVLYVGHTDGNFVPLLDMFLEAGIRAIQPCEEGAVDMEELKVLCGSRFCPIGNVNVDLLIRGTPEEVYRETGRLLTGVGRRDGFILSSGNVIMEETPRENVLAMVQGHGEFGVRRNDV